MFVKIITKTVRPFGAGLRRFGCAVALLAFLVGTCLPVVNAQTAAEEEAVTDAFAVTLQKAPLDEEYCTAVDTYIECVSDEVFLPADGAAAAAMASFYSVTGVQPYLIVTDDLNFTSRPDWEDDPVYYYLQDKYLRLFGMDEGHYLMLMLLKETGGFDVRSRAGNDAYCVMDDDAIEKTEALLLRTCDLNDLDNTLATVFTQAATEVMQYDEVFSMFEDGSGGYYTADGEYVFDPEMIMDKYTSSDDDFLGYLFGFILLPPAILIGIMIKRAKAENAAPRRNDTPVKTSAYENWANGYLSGAQNAPAKEAAPKRANYPITCPGCGATAYPNDDGTCQYCGRAIFDPRA